MTVTPPPEPHAGPVPPANQPGHQPPWPQDKPAEPPPAYAVPGPPRGSTAAMRHPFLFEPLMVPFALAVGVTPRTAWVDADAEHLSVRFGPWSLRTPIDNVEACEVTGGYALHKVAGPPHLSFRDQGVTFATNRQQGLCVRFAEPVPALAPFGLLRHPAATLTVADPHTLAAALGSSSVG